MALDYVRLYGAFLYSDIFGLSKLRRELSGVSSKKLEKLEWAIEFDESGHPIETIPGLDYQEEGETVVGLLFHLPGRYVHFKPWYETNEQYERNPLMDLVRDAHKVINPIKLTDCYGDEIKLD